MRQELKQAGNWLSVIVVWTVISLLIMLIINALMAWAIENALFMGLTPSISQLWPELMYPIGGLVILLNIIHHRPNRY